MKYNPWIWLLVALGLMALGVVIAIVIGMPA
jgi:hypothetical protein